ncbi:SdiA-regulated domain-containing protein [bacterium]|nr:SdiA-regulated domain-containing protein [bacterium]
MLKFLLCGACAAAAALAPSAGGHSDDDKGPIMAEVTEWQFEAFFELPEVPEPSGLCFCPDTQTIFAVDDGGVGREPGLYELDQDCRVLRSLSFGKDLEGVCFCPLDGMIYVADEADERVWRVRRSGAELALAGSFSVSREYQGQEFLEAGGNGFEGIEFMTATSASGYFLLLNQDDPHALVQVEYSDTQNTEDQAAVPIQQAWELEPINCGEVRFDPAENELWVVHSWMNTAEVLDPITMDLLRWEVMPGAAQEGLCFDEQHRMWVGQDLGGVARYVMGEK